MAARQALLVQLGGVDQYCYERQTGGKPSVEKARQLLLDSVSSLDKVIAASREARTKLLAAE